MPNDYTTAREDVQDITNQILAIQAADEGQWVESWELPLDTPISVRGTDKRYEYSLKEIAGMIGLENNPHPAKRVGNIYYASLKNFIKNQYFILHLEQAQRSGMTPAEADDFVALLYSLELQSGSDLKAIIWRMIDGEE